MMVCLQYESMCGRSNPGLSHCYRFPRQPLRASSFDRDRALLLYCSFVATCGAPALFLCRSCCVVPLLFLCCRAGKPVFERPSAIELESDPFLTTTLPGDETDTSDTILQIARENGMHTCLPATGTATAIVSPFGHLAVLVWRPILVFGRVCVAGVLSEEEFNFLAQSDDNRVHTVMRVEHGLACSHLGVPLPLPFVSLPPPLIPFLCLVSCTHPSVLHSLFEGARVVD